MDSHLAVLTEDVRNITREKSGVAFTTRQVGA
jgi:hypothetical protein